MVEQSRLLSHMCVPHQGTDKGFSLSGSSLPQPRKAATPVLGWHPIEAKNMTVTLGQVRGASLVVLGHQCVSKIGHGGWDAGCFSEAPLTPQHPIQSQRLCPLPPVHLRPEHSILPTHLQHSHASRASAHTFALTHSSHT